MVSRRSGSPKTTFRLDEARRHLVLLRHAGVGVTFIQVVPVGARGGAEHYVGLYQPDRYDQLLEDLQSLARDNPGELLKVYVGPNPRAAEALRYADHCLRIGRDMYADGFAPSWPDGTFIIERTALLIDLDHKESGKGTPTTDAQHEQSLALARQIKNEEPLLREAALFDSGNNAYLLAIVPPDLYHRDAVRMFYQHIRERFGLLATGAAPCKLDPCHDGYHIMGLAGTRKFKGKDPALWRWQSVLVEGGTCHELARHLKAYRAPEKRVSVTDSGLTVLEAAGSDEELAGRIELWCPGYRAIWTGSDFGDRSLAAFHLALKMYHDNWSWEDIHAALSVWAGRIRIEERRFEKIYKSLLSSIPKSAHRKSRPSHRHVVEVLGHCPCMGNCDVDLARSERVTLTEVDWGPSAEEEGAPGLGIARAELTMGIFDELHWAMGKRGRRTKQPRAVVSTSPAGTGKTHAALSLTRYLHKCVVTPRKAEFDKLLRDSVTDLDPETDTRARRLAGGSANLDEHRVVTILPREDCCNDPERRGEVSALNAAGAYAVVGKLVCDQCPQVGSCPYNTQFEPKDRCSFIGTSVQTRLPRFQKLMKQSDLVIFDEDPVSDCIERIKFKARDLERALQAVEHMPAHEQARTILGRLARVTRESDAGPEKVDARAILKAGEKIDLQRFGADYEQMLVESAPGQMPPAAIPDVLRTLAAQAKGNAGASMVLTERGELVLLRFHPFEIRSPVLVLDATGDERLYQRLFPRHAVRLEHSPTRLTAAVWQICDQALPMATLTSGDKAKKVSALIKKIAASREEDHGPGVAVIGRLETVKNLLELPPSVLTGHYWGTRGSRDFEDCHTMIVVGAAEPDFEWLRFEAEVIFGRRITRSDAAQEKLVVPYGLRSSRGKSWATSVRLYVDPDLRCLYQARREGEMVQAAYRIRPLEGEGKLIVVLSSIPLPGLPPTRLMTLQDLEIDFGLVEPSTRLKAIQTQEALRLELGREPTRKQVGERLGVTRQAIDKILGKAGGRGGETALRR